jgi:hypothetical protein
MRWFSIRRAKIDSELRAKVERLGVAVVQQIIASHKFHDWSRPSTSGVSSFNWNLDEVLFSKESEEKILEWLTEQYDRAERKETWTITMEAAVLVFVIFEVVLSLVSLFKH